MNISLQLSQQDIQVIMSALQEAPIPWKFTNPVMFSIEQQVQAANKPKEE